MDQTVTPGPRLRGLLIDIDGVLRIGSRPIPGAGDSIAYLRSRDIPFRLLTNVTRRSRAEEAARLRAMGIDVQPHELHTASSVTAQYLRRRGVRRCWVLLDGTAIADFDDFELSSGTPECVVLGDLNDETPIERLHQAFRALLAGAELIAIQRNGAWTGDDGLARLDVGAWIAALEFSSGQRATVLGKPARFAYQVPAEELGIPAEHLGMVADDPDVDLRGARELGLRTVFVSTTALPTRRPVEASEFDYVLESIADLPNIV